jgi:hypothetical protein
MSTRLLPFALTLFLVCGALAAEPKAPPLDPREVHLAAQVQLIRGG